MLTDILDIHGYINIIINMTYRVNSIYTDRDIQGLIRPPMGFNLLENIK